MGLVLLGVEEAPFLGRNSRGQGDDSLKFWRERKLEVCYETQDCKPFVSDKLLKAQHHNQIKLPLQYDHHEHTIML